MQGLFYGAPAYDIPALIAFLSILTTTVNFVTSVEVNFYPKYKRYFSLFNDGGAMKDIEITEQEMLTVLQQELNYLAQKQFVVTVLFIVIVGPLLLPYLGFTETMLGTFRILCVGYGLYAIANSIMLSLLYFADNTGALWTSLVFMVASTAGTLALLNGSQSFYGFGFLFGALLMYITAWIRLRLYTRKLQYHILCSQPVLIRENKGLLTAISRKLVIHAEKKQKKAWSVKGGSAAS